MENNTTERQKSEITAPLLSIVIPTKDRYTTLIPVVDSFLNHIIGDDYEIVIQDNSGDNTPWKEYAQSRQDEKIKYFYHAESLSVSENTDMAISNLSGKYAIFIGDDDLVSPYVLEITKYLDKHNVDCLAYSPGYYWWSSVNFVKESYYRHKQAFWLPNNISFKLQQKDSSKELEYLLKSGGVVLYPSLPKFYHGLVKKEVLDKIKTKIGTYISGSCPDMALAVSLTLVVDNYHYMQYPISVFGASKNSAAGWGQENKHWGKLEDQKHLPKNIMWDENIPRVWTGNTIYAQAIYETLSVFKADKKINYNALYAASIINEKQIASYVYPIVWSFNKGNIVRYFHLFYYLLRKFAGKTLTTWRERKKKLSYDVSTIDNVEGCMLFLAKQTKPDFKT